MIAILAFSTCLGFAGAVEPPAKTQSTGAGDANQFDCDIVVYGATSAGVIAAVQATRMNRTVVLLESGDHIGGLTSGGLGATDIGNKDVIGGLSREFYHRVAQHYADNDAWVHETREEFFKLRSKRTKIEEVLGDDATMWTFEPSVAARIFTELLDEAGIQVRLQQRLSSVEKNQTRITSLTTENGDVFRAKMFIDATYEGDLMAGAGVKYSVGRESNSQYGETLNGIRDRTPKNQIYGSVDPYVVLGDPSSGLIPLIQDVDGGTPGDGDHRVQAYNFRLCFTDLEENRLPLEPPENYDPGRYELAARRAEKIVSAGAEPHIKQFCNPVWMPNRKTDINNSQGISTDFIGGNYEYPDGNYYLRSEIWQAHEDYIRGFWYFMSSNPRVPKKLRQEFLSFGPCKDEFSATGGWPAQLYVREARRMVSDYVMSEANCRGKRVVKDSVGMAAYGMDSHNCQRIVQNGAARNEGDVQQHGLKPYPISYQSIIPKSSECENLVVPVCVSASHIAFGSIRMEPVFMVLGQSSAIAASLAIEQDVTLGELSYDSFRVAALAAGQTLQRPTQKKKSKDSDVSAVPASNHWTNATGNDQWSEPGNWSSANPPSERAKVYVDHAHEGAVHFDTKQSPKFSSIYVGSDDGRAGNLDITAGNLDATSNPSRHSRVGFSGGNGTVRQSGGSVRLNALEIANDFQSRGTYQLEGGSLLISRLVGPEVGSITICKTGPEAIGTMAISGGALITRSGVSVGGPDGVGIFSVHGSGCQSIGIGTHADHDGFWVQHSASILRFVVDQHGVSQIRVHDMDDSDQNGGVHFGQDANLDLCFDNQSYDGHWDVMTWDGTLVDEGLKLSADVDKGWDFRFVDTNQSGTADTLRVEYKTPVNASQ